MQFFCCLRKLLLTLISLSWALLVHLLRIDCQNSRPTIILAAMGVDLEGNKGILAIGACAQESQEGWLALLQDLRSRRVSDVDLIVTDGHEGRLSAVAALFTATPRQRCLVHRQPSADECHSQTRTRTDRRPMSRHLAATRAVSRP